MQNDPLVHPSGSLRFYQEIWGFYEPPSFFPQQTRGRARRASPLQKAQIGRLPACMPTLPTTVAI